MNQAEFRVGMEVRCTHCAEAVVVDSPDFLEEWTAFEANGGVYVVCPTHWKALERKYERKKTACQKRRRRASKNARRKNR